MNNTIFNIEPVSDFKTDEEGHTFVFVRFYSYRETGGFAYERKKIELVLEGANPLTSVQEMTEEEFSYLIKNSISSEEMAQLQSELDAKIDDMIANNSPFYHEPPNRDR